MFESFEPLDVYNKNINILIGSGASADLFPTLALGIKNAKGEKETIETLATNFENCLEKKTALFMHYYNTCIYPVQNFKPDAVATYEGKTNLDNYELFLTTLLGLLDRRQGLNRKINIFTTNYDGCVTHAADSLLKKGSHDFVVNDGTSGFHRKYLHSKNFSTFQCQTGIFERTNYGIPQLNIIHLHGSVYWSKSGDKIEVGYTNEFGKLLNEDIASNIHELSNFLSTKHGVTENLPPDKFNRKQNRMRSFDPVGEKKDLEEEENDLPEIQLEDLKKDLSTISKGCRLVFELFYLDDYNHQEIASELQISVSTSKSQLHYAKRLLKEQLMKHYEA